MRTQTLLLLLAASGLAATACLGGPLNPPAGPVGPTMKTLAEVEPRTAINAANTPGDATNAYKLGTNGAGGSYYLTANLYVPPGYNGLQIAASNVTVDLNGFMIYGLQGSLKGITTDGLAHTNVAIRNGSVVYFGVAGVSLPTCTSSEVRGIVAWGTGGDGIQVGDGSTVSGCTAAHCAQTGIATGDQCTVCESKSSSNQYGFSGTGKDTFAGCTASDNSAIGFNLGSATTIRECQAVHNTQQGMVFVDNCTVVGNQCRANGGNSLASIWAQGNGSTIQNNQTSESGYGIYVGGNNNTVSGNVVTSPAQRALYAGGINNLIIQNTAYNTVGGFQIVPFNRVGAIFQPNFNPQLISGTSGGGLGVTDLYANLIIN